MKKKINEVKETFLLGTVKKVTDSEGKSVITVVASDETKDRHGEVIKVDGWDIKNFKKNPVMLTSHRWDSLPVGKWVNVRIEDGKLLADAQFSTTPAGQEVMQLVDEEILGAVSVGAIIKERDENDDDVITKAELLEISWVSLPANPNALRRGLDLGFRFVRDEDSKLTDELVKDYLAKKDMVIVEKSEYESTQEVVKTYNENKEVNDKNANLVAQYSEVLPEYRKSFKILREKLGIQPDENEVKQIVDTIEALKDIVDGAKAKESEVENQPSDPTKTANLLLVDGLTPDKLVQMVAEETSKTLKKYFN